MKAALASPSLPHHRLATLEREINSVTPAARGEVRKARIEAIQSSVRSRGSMQALRELGIRLSFADAMEVTEWLNHHNVPIQPYDLPSVWSVWDRTAPNGIPYRVTAFAEALDALAARRGLKADLVAGFAAILPELSRPTFEELEINPWGTRIRSMFYGASRRTRSVYEVLNETLRLLGRFKRIAKIGVAEHDLPRTAPHYWIDERGAATPAARGLLRVLLERIAEQKGVTLCAASLPDIGRALHRNDFRDVSLNRWGTTARSMLWHAYKDKISEALDDFERHTS